MATTPGRSPGGFRGYNNEQKTLRAKLDQVLKWTRDLKSNIMKQSCKALGATTNNRETIDRMHDDIDDYKRKLDRELGRIHDICDALMANTTNGMNGADDEENRLFDEDILEALRRSPTYTSLEQHMDGESKEKRPRIRVKPRERSHPGQSASTRAPFMSTNTVKRKASQPISWQLIDTSSMPGGKRRPHVDAFKRSRSFTNVDHTETQLGMDYIEEDENDIAWKPFGPKKAVSQSSISFTNNDQPTDEQSATTPTTTTQSLPCTPIEKPKPVLPPASADEASSDEEFDVAWQRRAKQVARKEAASAPATAGGSPTKRTVHFSPTTRDPIEVIELDLEDPSEGEESQQQQQQPPASQTENGHDEELVLSVAPLNENETSAASTQQTETETPVASSQTQSQITMTSAPPSSSSQQQTQNNPDESQVIDLSDDEIIALSENDVPAGPSPTKVVWTASEIQITGGNSQSLHNPYRIGIADPSLRSIFLPPPGSQPLTTSSSGSKRSSAANRKTSPSKRAAGAK